MTDYQPPPVPSNSLRAALHSLIRLPRTRREIRRRREQMSPEDRELNDRLHREYMVKYTSGAGPLMHEAMKRLSREDSWRLWSWANRAGPTIHARHDRQMAMLRWMAEAGRTGEKPDVDAFLSGQ